VTSVRLHILLCFSFTYNTIAEVYFVLYLGSRIPRIRGLDTADYPLFSTGYYYNGSLIFTNGGMDWIQQRHIPAPFVLQRILLKWTPTNKNSRTDLIQLATSQDIIQLNTVTNTNRGMLLAFMLVCKFWLGILPITFALALHSRVAINGLKWRMGEGGVWAYR
jgi:hypothetical protein